MTPSKFASLFDEFKAPSWSAWRKVLAQLTPAIREFYAVVGRGGGKSRFVALLACCFASRHYRRAPGERIYVGVFGPDRKQARITFRYVAGLLRSVPELSRLVEREADESLDLTNGVTVEVVTANRAAPRGRSYALVVIEEACFLPQEDSANPDLELVRAVRPALARVPGSLLAVVSSPYAKRGVLYDAWVRYRERPTEDVVLVHAPTLELNPTFDAHAIEKARAEDPVAAACEYDAEFRADVMGYIDRAVVEACVEKGTLELPPESGTAYRAFCDPSGGSGTDSFTLAVAHEEDGVAVVDATREARPPFSPRATAAEYAELLRTYGISSVTGDRYAGEWPREAFRVHGIAYEPSERVKSEIYVDFVAVLNSRRVELPDDPRLVAQIASLERRAGAGRDVIDHPPGGHDDVANAVAGVATLVSLEERNCMEGKLTW